MFTSEKIEKLHQLTEAVGQAKWVASEQLRTAQDRTGERVHKLKRKDGTTSKITEKTMWDEVFYLGVACESGQFLQKKHPEVFEAYTNQDKAADELKRFCIADLGVDYTAMTISDYIKLTEQMFEYMLDKYQIAHEIPSPINKNNLKK